MILTEDLRLSILQAAVEGKLTEQSAKDTPVETTLDRLQDIKNNLADNKKIKKAALKTEDSIPFNIPDNWTWVKLCDIGELARGKSKHRPRNDESLYIDGTIPMIQTGDVAAANKYITQFNTCYNEKGLAQSRLWKKGTLCITIAANIGDVAILTFDACFPDSVLGFLPFSEQVSKEYVYYMLLAYKHRMNAKASKMAQSNLSLDKINSMLFPFPPIEEQLRIVDCLDMLFCKVDEYEKLEQQLTVLKNKFPSDMREAILQSALQGKLTEQLETDSFVDELLELIFTEKENLILAGEIKREKPLPSITDDDIPFEIPVSWRWERWGNLANSIQYGYNAPAIPQGDIRMVRISDIQDNIVDWNTVPYCQISEKEIPVYLLAENDLLFARTGGTVGKSYLVTNMTERAIYAGYLIRSNYNKRLCPQYLKYFMDSPLYWSQLRNGTTQTAQPNCNGKTLSKMMIPIPPIEEQQRIVKQLDILLPLCDNLVE